MSKNKELADYIMDQLSDLGDIRNIPMMGGYIFSKERTDIWRNLWKWFFGKDYRGK